MLKSGCIDRRYDDFAWIKGGNKLRKRWDVKYSRIVPNYGASHLALAMREKDLILVSVKVAYVGLEDFS